MFSPFSTVSDTLIYIWLFFKIAVNKDGDKQVGA